MAKNVFISFRYSDGNGYKEYLSNLFDKFSDTVDYSEDVDRSYMSDATIQQYLYRKLRRSSVTIILLTPSAVNHKRNWRGDYDDWMYDEIRFSLENREGNRTLFEKSQAVFFISPVSHEADPPLWKIRSLKFRKYDPPSSPKK